MEDSEIYVNLTFRKTGSLSRNPHKQQTNENIGNRPYRLICLLSLFTLVLFVTVVRLLIHVSQIRQPNVTSDQNNELISTLPSKFSALNSNLSDVKRMHSDLRHQFTEMETKCRSVNETKDQISELLTSRREQAFSLDWIRNKDGCYFISTFNYSYDEAKQYCWNFDSKLLEINSTEEENFVSKAIRNQGRSYWTGKGKDREVASYLMFRMVGGESECGLCGRYTEYKPCSQIRTPFICEKSAPLCPDIPEKIRDL